LPQRGALRISNGRRLGGQGDPVPKPRRDRPKITGVTPKSAKVASVDQIGKIYKTTTEGI